MRDFPRVHGILGRSLRGLARTAGIGALALAVGVVTSILAGAAAASEERPRTEELADLSLEDMLDVQLDLMGISGIHHTHEQGDVMVGYSFMMMDMDGNRDGTKHLDPSDLFADGYMVSPLKMDMQMHMFHLMYAPLDDPRGAQA